MQVDTLPAASGCACCFVILAFIIAVAQLHCQLCCEWFCVHAVSSDNADLMGLLYETRHSLDCG